MADGFITIKTRIDNSKFDKQIGDLEKKISKEEQKGIELKTKMSSQQSALNAETREAQKLEKEYEKVSQKLEYLQSLQSKKDSGGSLSFQQTTDLLDLESTAKAESTLGASLDKIYTKQDKIRAQMSSTSAKYKEITSRVDEYKTKINGINLQKQQADVNRVKEGFKGVGDNIKGVMQKVARLAIGVLGIRTALTAVRRASSDLAGYDQQYATNLEYIRFVLTQTIAPVLRWIVSLAATLLNYIYAIAGAWFGIGKNSNISAEAFKKMKSSAGGVAKSAKEIRKQLAGFDEMNVLGDNTSASGGGGGASVPQMPSFDIGGDTQIPAWLQFILDHKEEIISGLLGIAAGLWAVHAGATGLQALGIGLLVGGIVYAIQAFLEYLKDPTWENFGKIIQGIGGAIVGLGILIGSVPAIVAGVAVLIVGTIVKYWDQIKDFLQKGIDWLKGKTDWVKENFGIVGEFIYKTFTDLLQGVLNIFDNIFSGIKKTFDGVIEFVKGVFSGNWQQAWNGIKMIFEGVWQAIGGTVKTVFETIGNIASNAWEMLKNGASLAWEGIKLIFSKVAEFFRNTFETAWTAVKNVFSTGGKIFDGIKDGIVTAFKAIVNAIINGINKVIEVPFNAINNVLNKIRNIDIVGQKPFSFIGTISVPKIPTLATGGIVNLPGSGVPVAMAGEAGREGVLPLTDSQAMAELGREIGRWITINANITNTMNGRIISRELKTIQNEESFAFNS